MSPEDALLPATMRALRLLHDGPQPHLECREIPLPWLRAGQVLVRVTSAPVHGQDLAFLRGTWALRRPLPATPGLEGVGEVVASGGGWVARMLEGRRVAFLAPPDVDGTWAEYAVTDVSRCVPLGGALGGPGPLGDAEAATALVTPLTALALTDLARAHGSAGLLLSGAGGALGRAVARLARAEGLHALLTVRHAASVEPQRQAGADEVFVEDDPELLPKLRRATRAWRVTWAACAVGGPLTGLLLAAMPDGAEVASLGRLSGAPATVDTEEFTWRGKRLRGWSLPEHVAAQGAPGLLGLWPRARRHLPEVLGTRVLAQPTLVEAPAAIEAWASGRGTGKLVLRVRT
jgi:NADPH2:quinone reductase